jgi:hypothetical protein
MTGRTEDRAPARDSLPALPADQHTGTSPTVTPTSSLETDMHLIPEQMARSHMESRHQEAQAWRVRRLVRAVRRAEAAERRARLAREAAVLASREPHLLVAR